jgi:inhibitor of KinA
MTITPLGDQAILAYCLDEAAAVRFARDVRAAGFPWLLDVVPAYSSVGIFFNPDFVRSIEAEEALCHLAPSGALEREQGQQFIVPCCYSMELDLARVARHTGLSAEEIIARHCDREYTVYAIGFAPGFPYLGYLAPELCGVPRLASQRLRVEPGSVGLTGTQTGIYPLVRPGGWNIVGRTPLTLVDMTDNYFPLHVGDRVSFRRIDEREFRELEGQRIT